MNTFDDIRPYYEEEIPAAMQRIAAHESFPKLAQFVFPNQEVEKVRKMVAAIQTIEDFQHQVMNVFNHEVIRRSIQTFTFDGLNRIEHNKAYLYVSNHRDIVLDSAYPLNSLSYVFGIIAAILLLGEKVSAWGWLGVCLIISGCFLVSMK